MGFHLEEMRTLYPRYCEERSDTAIHATVELLETLPQIARLQLDRHVPCGHSQ
jgi:hypothetical protein